MTTAVDLQRATIAVTGAGGFIGGRTCARLAAAGARVIGIDVDPGAADALDSGQELRVADVTDERATALALRDCDLVVHTAAVVSETGAMEDFVAVNVAGTRNVLNAAREGRATRVVHVSSTAIWGYEFTADVDDDAPARRCGVPYVDTKAASDTIARRAGAVVVRPGDVYGPGSLPWTVRPVELMRARRFFLPSPGDGLITPLYIDDLVAALECGLLAGEEAGGRAVTVWDGQPVTAIEFFGHYSRMLGRKTVPTLPRALLLAGAGLEELRARVQGDRLALGRAAATFVSRRAAYPSRRARELLGWEPRVTLAEGMRRTAQWLAEQGLVPASATA